MTVHFCLEISLFCGLEIKVLISHRGHAFCSRAALICSVAGVMFALLSMLKHPSVDSNVRTFQTLNRESWGT